MKAIPNRTKLRKLAESFGASPTDSRDDNSKVVMMFSLEQLRKFLEHFAPAQSCGDAEQADAPQAVTTDDMEKAVRNSKWGKDIQSRNAFREGWKTALTALLRASEQSGEDAANGAMGEREAWEQLRGLLAVAMCSFATKVGRKDLDAAVSVLDAITEPGSPMAWLRAALTAEKVAGQATDDASAAAEFYAANPNAALVDFQKRFAPQQSAEQDGREAWDGDSEESRAAFRAYDERASVSTRSTWQIWRDACAWQASRAVLAAEKAAAEPKDWRVGLFYSSSDPRKQVRVLAEGRARIEEYEKHRSFVRWIDDPEQDERAETSPIDAHAAWEMYLNAQKQIIGMPGLRAMPCFIAGYRAASTQSTATQPTQTKVALTDDLEELALSLTVEHAPKHEFRDPDDGQNCFSALGFARDIVRALVNPDACQVNKYSSRMCEKGTVSCETEHAPEAKQPELMSFDDFWKMLKEKGRKYDFDAANMAYFGYKLALELQENSLAVRYSQGFEDGRAYVRKIYQSRNDRPDEQLTKV